MSMWRKQISSLYVCNHVQSVAGLEITLEIVLQHILRRLKQNPDAGIAELLPYHNRVSPRRQFNDANASWNFLSVDLHEETMFLIQVPVLLEEAEVSGLFYFAGIL